MVQQAREEDLDDACARLTPTPSIAAHIAPFFRDLPERIAKAHLVIARAGASTVAELMAIGRPCLLVPLPHALDNDQLENATRLQEVGGGWCVRQSELSAERLAGMLQDLLSSPERLADAAKKAHGMATVDAVKRLADLVEELAEVQGVAFVMHMPDPQKTGLVHIVGIGGIGMSAIAEVMHTRGYTVQGSDLKDSANLERLRARNIRCLIGHDPANLDGAATLVISSAVKAGNPEFEAAKERGIPIIRRAEMLAELMRPCATVSITGTHGKTTTTSLIADLLKGGGLDPTVIAGGIINDWGTNARIGKGEWMVVEADESDGTFLKLPTQIGVVTNIDPEHMDYWQSVQAHASRLPAIHRSHSLLRARGCLHRSSRGARASRQARRRRQWSAHARPMAWRATPISGSPISGPTRDRIAFDARLGSGVARRRAHARGSDAAGARSLQRAECARGARRRGRGRRQRRRDPRRPSPASPA